MDKKFNEIMEINLNDLINEFIRLKGYDKEIKEKISALQTLLLIDENTEKDDRVKVVRGKETYILTERAYERLALIGERIEVVETRRKKFDEFDVEVQKEILKNEENYTTTKRSDYILVNRKK